MLFLLDRGLNYTEITFLDVAFFGTILVASLPAGVISDRYGRKKGWKGMGRLTLRCLDTCESRGQWGDSSQESDNGMKKERQSPVWDSATKGVVLFLRFGLFVNSSTG